MDIIIPHINTDLDALGAAVGAQVLYPQAVIVLPGPPTRAAGEFISLHRYTLRIRTARDVDLQTVSRAVVVDTADPVRLADLRAVAARCEVHVFDHHPPEDGDLPAAVEVRDLVGSTCTLLAEIIAESGATVTPVQATAMLLGIYADTGSLSFTSTTDRDARAAAFLLAHGANLRAMARFLQTGLTPAQHSLLQQIQAHSRTIGVQGVRIRLLEGETREYVSGLAAVVHGAQAIDPAPALFAAVRMGDRVYLVGRSEVPWVDAARVMLPFGGGGHPSAASAVVKGLGAHTVLEQVEAALARVVERPLAAADTMTGPVKSVVEDLPVRDAERLMLRYGHSGLPVVDETGRLKGIISLRDAEKARRHGLMHAPVKGMMIRKVYTVTPQTPLDEIQALMIERDIGRVPVVEDGNLVGIVSRSDLLGLLYGGLPPRWHRTLYAGPSAPGPADADDPGAALVRRGLEGLSPELRSHLNVAGTVASEMGTSAFAVGGFVRDLLLDRPNLDVDIVVEGDGIAYAERLGATLGATVKQVKRFGSAHLFLPGPRSGAPLRIDIASARREFYEHAAALPVVEHAGLREDLYRRDFSINAMAVRLGNGGPSGLVDFYGGLGDLKAGQIRVLHTFSFVEDPTRILRAVRFAHRYSFALDPETADLARRAVTEGFLRRVSVERLRNELLLILQEPCSGGPLAELASLGALKEIVPGLELPAHVCRLVNRVDQMDQTVPDLAQLAAPWAIKLLALLHSMGPAEGVAAATHLRLRREPGQALLHTLGTWRMSLAAITAPALRPSEAVRLLREHAPEGLLLLYLLGAEEIVTRYWRQWRHVRLAITGHDLAQAGVPEGPAIGRALVQVLDDTLDGLVPDRESQLQRALRYANEEA